MLNKTKEKLISEVKDLVREQLSKWGLCRNQDHFGFTNYEIKNADLMDKIQSIVDKKISHIYEIKNADLMDKIQSIVDKKISHIKEDSFRELGKLRHKQNLLIKHLKLEYYKKEIKETNGCEKNYVEEGFRKVVK